jgi:hypothetical protein
MSERLVLGIRSHLLPHLAPRLLAIPAVRRLAVGLISQLRIAYPASLWVPNSSSMSLTCGIAGR